MFHISDCKKYTRCPRLYLYNLEDDTKEYHPFVRLDEKVTDLAKQKLGIQECFIGNVGDEPSKALNALNEYEWLMKARFEYKNLRVKVPFLHKHDDGWDLYFLFTGIYPHSNDMQFYTNTVWVLEKNKIHIKDVRMLHFNANYIRGKELDVNALFTITDCFYNNHNNPSTNIKEEIEKNMGDLSGVLNRMSKVSWDTVEDAKRTNKCTGRNKCKYYEKCFPNEKEEQNNSILTLISSSQKYNMQKEGILYLKDADVERIEGSRQQYAQIQADKNGGLYVDKLALKNWLSHIKYPIAFLDFEWERFAIPPYEGMKPYDVLPFEYALDIMQEDGSISQKVYLNIHDDRRDMAESLIKDIPEIGSIIAYNAEGAEKVRIQEFIDLYPDLSEPLQSINQRMEDMQLPFMNGVVYNTQMRGLWSLKSIMNMMDDTGYKDLDIRQGMDAVFQWRHLDYEEVSKEEKEKIIEDLKKYCGMDSYAMSVVYKWLVKVSE